MLALWFQRYPFDAHAAVVLARIWAWIDSGSQRVVLWCGYPSSPRLAIGGASQSEYVQLISLGTGSAYIYSVLATIVPQIFLHRFVGRGQIDVYFEPAAVIVALVLLGR